MSAFTDTGQWIPVCRMPDIPRRSSRRFTLGTGRHSLEIILIRKYTRVFAYRNCCPHQAISLDLGSEDVLTDDKRYIMCVNHAAVFDIENGQCLAGPCLGECLEPLKTKVEQERIYVRMP